MLQDSTFFKIRILSKKFHKHARSLGHLVPGVLVMLHICKILNALFKKFFIYIVEALSTAECFCLLSKRVIFYTINHINFCSTGSVSCTHGDFLIPQVFSALLKPVDSVSLHSRRISLNLNVSDLSSVIQRKQSVLKST